MAIRNSTRLRRLRTLASLMFHHKTAFKEKDLKFNINFWHCGTAACALGSAACYHEFNKEGLKFPSFNRDCDFKADVKPQSVGKRVQKLIAHYEKNKGPMMKDAE